MDTNTTNFSAVFTDALTQLERDAKAAGSNITEVCREAGVSRTTPDRWKAKTPSTVALVTRMQSVVAEKTAAKAAKAAKAAAAAAAAEQPPVAAPAAEQPASDATAAA